MKTNIKNGMTVKLNDQQAIVLKCFVIFGVHRCTIRIVSSGHYEIGLIIEVDAYKLSKTKD